MEDYKHGEYKIVISNLKSDYAEMKATFIRRFKVDGEIIPTGNINYVINKEKNSIQGAHSLVSQGAYNSTKNNSEYFTLGYTVDYMGIPLKEGNTAIDITTGDVAGIIYEDRESGYLVASSDATLPNEVRPREREAIHQKHITSCGTHTVSYQDVPELKNAQVGDIIYQDKRTYADYIGVITLIDDMGESVFIEIACPEREVAPYPIDLDNIIVDERPPVNIPPVRPPVYDEIYWSSWNQNIDGSTYHTVFIKDGFVYWMGGQSPGRTSVVPERIEGLSDIVQIAATIRGFIALDRFGIVYESEDGFSVKKIAQEIIQIDAGDNFIILLDRYGRVKVIGDNEYGQGGYGIDGGHTDGTYVVLPLQAIQVAAGGKKAGAILKDNSVYMWGDNSGKKISTEAEIKISKPVKISLANGAIRLLVDTNGNVVITPSSIIMWGGDTFSGFNIPITIPTSRRQFNKIAFNGGVLFALREDGIVFSMGKYNDFGQLGIGNSNLGGNAKEFFVVKTMTNRMVDIGAGPRSGYAIDSKGNVWSWGNNTEGQLGIGSKGQGKNYYPVMTK